jgi:DeoR/GlpR family transcriptional regulator of sugar metabolism
MTLRLTPAERQNEIVKLLTQKNSAHVGELGELLGVSEITIRRDLEILETKHIVERTHGGALLSQRLRSEPQFSAKHQTHVKEKHQIGAAAAALVEPQETIFIGSGSTTQQIFSQLFGKKNRVITSNAAAINECQSSDIDLILTGGSYRERSHSLTGLLAVQLLQRFYVQKCFIGVDGVSIQYGLTTPNLEEAEVGRTMIEHTNGLVIVVADSSKLGVVADCLTVPLDKIDILVTDSGFDEGYRQEIENLGIKIILAS